MEGTDPSANEAGSSKGIVCSAPVTRRPSERGILMAMQQRSRNNALTGFLQARLMWSVLTLPTGMIRRSSSIVHGAMGLAEGALGALNDLAKNTTATGGLVVQHAVLGGRFLLDQTGGLGGRYGTRGEAVQRTYAGTMEAMAFVRNFDVEYGASRPDFERVSFVEAVSRAVREYKLMFTYLHSSDQARTGEFCQRTLCAEKVVKFINSNFVSWGGDIRSSEGFQMSICLKATTFPFCAVIAASSPQHLVVLQQVNGSVSGTDLVATLEQLLKQRGGALSVARSEHAEIARCRRLRDAAANQALVIGAKERPPRDHRPSTAPTPSPSSTATSSESSKGESFVVAPPRRRRWFFGR